MAGSEEIPFQYLLRAAELCAESLPQDTEPEDRQRFITNCAQRFWEKRSYPAVTSSGPVIAASIAHQPPEILVNAAVEAHIDPARCNFPSLVKVFGMGLIEIFYGKEKYSEFAGEGEMPTLLDDFALPQDRIDAAPLVMIKEPGILYAPVTVDPDADNQRVTLASLPGLGLPRDDIMYRTEPVEHDGFIDTTIIDVRSEHLAEVIRDPRILLEHPEYFTNIMFSSSDPSHYGNSFYSYLAAEAGTQIPFPTEDKYAESDFPHYSGYRVNDGAGHCSSYLGPYKLVTIRDDERVMRKQGTNMVMGKQDDFILLDPDSNRRSIFTRDVAEFRQLDVYPCRSNGEVDERFAPMVRGWQDETRAIWNEVVKNPAADISGIQGGRRTITPQDGEEPPRKHYSSSPPSSVIDVGTTPLFPGEVTRGPRHR